MFLVVADVMARSLSVAVKHAHVHARARARTHTHTHARARARLYTPQNYAHRHRHMHAPHVITHTDTYINTYIHAYRTTYTYVRTNERTRAHTRAVRAQALSELVGSSSRVLFSFLEVIHYASMHAMLCISRVIDVVASSKQEHFAILCPNAVRTHACIFRFRVNG